MCSIKTSMSDFFSHCPTFSEDNFDCLWFRVLILTYLFVNYFCSFQSFFCLVILASESRRQNSSANRNSLIRKSHQTMRYICAVSAGTFWGKIKKDRKGMSKTVLATVREASVTINQHLGVQRNPYRILSIISPLCRDQGFMIYVSLS